MFLQSKVFNLSLIHKCLRHKKAFFYLYIIFLKKSYNFAVFRLQLNETSMSTSLKHTIYFAQISLQIVILTFACSQAEACNLPNDTMRNAYTKVSADSLYTFSDSCRVFQKVGDVLEHISNTRFHKIMYSSNAAYNRWIHCKRAGQTLPWLKKRLSAKV